MEKGRSREMPKTVAPEIVYESTYEYHSTNYTGTYIEATLLADKFIQIEFGTRTPDSKLPGLYLISDKLNLKPWFQTVKLAEALPSFDVKTDFRLVYETVNYESVTRNIKKSSLPENDKLVALAELDVRVTSLNKRLKANTTQIIKRLTPDISVDISGEDLIENNLYSIEEYKKDMKRENITDKQQIAAKHLLRASVDKFLNKISETKK